eukprot:TRINITY_DN65238_c0_g1_i1.p2 TRINITY_DN65238_c0_g1~~TRINITY_DN65238_c0_g1_i1.p2  ORF type:complete len:206 (-),score=64.59 TRINITY_DN65238_c0_g1_i1:138-755(-)
MPSLASDLVQQPQLAFAQPQPRLEGRRHASSLLDVEGVLQQMGLMNNKGANPYKGLPEAECGRLRPPLLPKGSCNTAEALAKEAKADTCQPAPPSCCENARRAEAALKLAQDAIDNSWLLKRFQPKGPEVLRAVQEARDAERDAAAAEGRVSRASMPLSPLSVVAFTPTAQAGEAIAKKRKGRLPGKGGGPLLLLRGPEAAAAFL